MITFIEPATNIKAFDIDNMIFINYQNWIKSENIKVVYRHCKKSLMIVYFKLLDN